MSSARARTRQAILAATATVLGRDRKATLPAIAEAAGVGRTTVHRYFPDRDQLITAAITDSIEAIDQAVAAAALGDGEAVDAMRRLVAALVSVGDRLLFLFGDPRVFEQYEPSAGSRSADDATITLIERGQAEGAFDPGVSAGWIQHVLWALVYTGHEEAVNGRLPRHGVAATVLRTLENGIHQGRPSAPVDGPG